MERDQSAVLATATVPHRRASHIARRERGVWQRRFWEHHLRTETDKANAVRYCLTNPVKHGLVTDPSVWPYSSIHRDIRNGQWAAWGAHLLRTDDRRKLEKGTQ